MPGPRLDGLVVLLVEDDEDLRALMALALEARGATVEGAGDANEARHKLRAGRPGIIVCDIGLPGEDGCSLLRSLPESSENPRDRIDGSTRQRGRARRLQNAAVQARRAQCVGGGHRQRSWPPKRVTADLRDKTATPFGIVAQRT